MKKLRPRYVIAAITTVTLILGMVTFIVVSQMSNQPNSAQEITATVNWVSIVSKGIDRDGNCTVDVETEPTEPYFSQCEPAGMLPNLYTALETPSYGDLLITYKNNLDGSEVVGFATREGCQEKLSYKKRCQFLSS